MPPTPSITRRSRVFRIASVVAGAAAVAACSSTASPAMDDAASSSTTSPAVELEAEAGVLRTTVEVARRDDSEDLPDELLLVGDSVLVLVADDLARRVGGMLVVDAADCRRIDAQIAGPCGGVPGGASVSSGLAAVLDARAGETTAPDAAVLVLANNSAITREHVDAVMEAAVGIDHVWWVTTRTEGLGRQDLNNQVLVDLAERDPRAGLVDWHAESEGQDWLADNVHPNEEGQAALAALVADRLRCACTA